MTSPTSTSRDARTATAVVAVGVGAVVLLHAGVLPGGWLGTDVLLVVLGAASTIAFTRSGDVAALRRIGGRLARLSAPALVATLALAAVFARTGVDALHQQVRGEALASVIGLANFEALARGGSDWETGTASPLAHLWAVSLAAQLVVLWWLVLAVARAVGVRSTSALRIAVGVLLVALAAWTAFVASTGTTARVFYGTDTRSLGFVLGALLALLAAGPVVSATSAMRANPTIAAAGIATYLVHLPVFALLDEERLGADGLALLSARLVATAVLVAVVVVATRAVAAPALPDWVRPVFGPPAVVGATLAVFAATAGFAVTPPRADLDPPSAFCSRGSRLVEHIFELRDAMYADDRADAELAAERIAALHPDELPDLSPTESRDITQGFVDVLDDLLAAHEKAEYELLRLDRETQENLFDLGQWMTFFLLTQDHCPPP